MDYSINESNDLGLFRTLPNSEGRLFVIGDIHGCLKELNILLENILKQLNKEDWLIFIGDYIDRGPSTAGVVNLLLKLQQSYPNFIFLKGNHEAMLLNFIDGQRSMQSGYLKHGGKETFESYQVQPIEIFENPTAGIPGNHIDFYKNLELGIHAGQFLITHAGINPNLPIHAQTENELLWSREGFVDRPHPWPYTIVFGHTPFKDVNIEMPYKIGIDTGLVYGNLLSCMELQEGIIFQIKLGSEKLKQRKL
jgi:serine/threonine protein phosphatase 1